MVLLEFFSWELALPSSISETLLASLQGRKETNWCYSEIICLVLGAVFILLFCFYVFAAKTIKCTGTFATPQFPAILSSKKKKIKRHKPKKSSQKRLTKAQRLQEANRKWSAIYCSDNSDYEEPENITTVPFGSLEITEVKKVSFRDTIQDVYFIESKEEMRRLEELQSMGYDVTITRPKSSARKKTTQAAVFEEKETALYPAMSSTSDNYSDKTEYTDITKRAVKKLVEYSGYQMGDVKIGSYGNRIFKDEERLLEIPLLRESTI